MNLRFTFPSLLRDREKVAVRVEKKLCGVFAGGPAAESGFSRPDTVSSTSLPSSERLPDPRVRNLVILRKSCLPLFSQVLTTD